MPIAKPMKPLGMMRPRIDLAEGMARRQKPMMMSPMRAESQRPMRCARGPKMFVPTR